MKKEFRLTDQSIFYIAHYYDHALYKQLSRLAAITLLLSITYISHAQQTVSALHIDEEIKIDAIFNEAAWAAQSDIATDFTSVSPVPNAKPKYPTEIKVIYDDDALYISATMVEESQDSISSQLMLRDQIGNTDFIGVIIDTYGNGNNAFEFILSCTGVQFDALVTPQNEDSSWDAVWHGSVMRTDEGWVAEMKIPYSAIRFPAEDVQNWNVNFFRRRSVSGEQYCWNNVDFEQDNPWLTQLGTLTGIENIKPPLRLSLTPYASVYGVHSQNPTNDDPNSFGSSYNMGMDIKYGINDAFTLDMTLIPDFGQVQSDNQILNLSPFEVRFSENRAFFTEGIEMFDKSGIFYSRRVGNNQQLYNATKVSGRTEKGLGIGLFNAVAAEKSTVMTGALGDQEVKHVEMPLTNFNIVVFDQDLKNNSSVSLTNTSVLRRGDQFHNANVTASTFNLKNAKQTFGVSGKLAVSQLINKQSDNVNGYDSRISIDKLSGMWVAGLGYAETSKDYNHNDLGFFTFGNYRETNFYLVRRDLDGFGSLNRFNVWLNGSYQRNIVPSSFVSARANTGFYLETKEFFRLNGWVSINSTTNDFNEPRVQGRYFERPQSTSAGVWFGTDQRKKLQFQLWSNFNTLDQDWIEKTVGSAIRYRFSDKLNISLDMNINKRDNVRAFANITDDSQIIFGKRDFREVSNNFLLNYNFNKRMGIRANMRHYWSKVHYDEYYVLGDDGGLAVSDYNGFHDLSFNAFTIDAEYRWRFAPGSEIAVVWKNNITGVYQDQMLDYRSLDYTSGISRLKSLPQTNSLSVRFSYYLDYNENIKGLLAK